MKPTLTIGNAVVYHGNNLEVLPTLPDNSVDSIVCDPPYELGFMGKKWDSSGIAYSVELWTECIRVLKPGGHLLAFGGSRTWHRLAVAIEDAGFEIRDSIAWLYGSGFPKSMDISKAIDKQAGAQREVLTKTTSDLFGEREEEQTKWRTPSNKPEFATKWGFGANSDGHFKETAPATDEAKQWAGWGTALKPAFEPVVVARKPLSGKTVAENVLTWGTGGLNIDGSRIGANDAPEGRSRHGGGIAGNSTSFELPDSQSTMPAGRWPANIILDEYTAGLLDEQSGVSKDGTATNRNRTGKKPNEVYAGGWGNLNEDVGYGGSGGASRFFYVAKASKKDRNEGLENIEAQSIGDKGNGLARACSTCGASVLDGCECPDRTFVNPERKNFHPTVKPTAIMEYLIKLVTPPNGTVLDPFTGSGSTGKAALLNGFHFIGIELTEEYLPIIEGRLTHASQAKEEEESETLF